jgi:hypothetical protein
MVIPGQQPESPVNPHPWRTSMVKTVDASLRRGISLDTYAVTLALVLALLIHLNLIPPIQW